MAARLIPLRYDATCAACGVGLPANTSAWWDSAAKATTCQACGGGEDQTPPVSNEAPPGADDETPVPPKQIRVRYAGTCASCGAGLPAGAAALWERSTRTMTCLECPTAQPHGSASGIAGVRGPAVTDAGAPAHPAPTSAAGASAQREYERRKAKREQGIRARHPHLGGLILALSDDPQSTTAWAKGAEGERRLGAGLDALAAAGIVALHDRRIPGTRANIDHLAVTPTGVWVIDAKRYTGQVAKRDVGGWFSTDLRLYVGRRDCTKLLGGMAGQVAAVRTALGAEGPDVPVRPVLCFVDAEWGWFARPFELDGVLVAWPKATRELLARPGPYTPKGIGLIAGVLEAKLKPAS